MRSLIVASVAALLALAQCANATNQADVQSARSSPVGMDSTNLPAGTTCRPTAPPLVVTPANIFQGYFCSNTASWGTSSERCFLYHYDSTIKGGGRWTMKYMTENSVADDCFPEQPVKVFATIHDTYIATINGEYVAAQKKVETYVLGFDAKRGVSGSIYKLPKYGNAEGITVTNDFSVVFARGDHLNTTNGVTYTSLESVNGMTGQQVWSSAFFATAYFSKPIFYEEHIYTLVGAKIFRVPSDTGLISFHEGYYLPNPCNYEDSLLKDKVNMTLVTFGFETDAAGNTQELKALLLYSNTPSKRISTPHFSLCRIHHGGNSFGQADGLFITLDDTRSVNAITGGGNLTFITFADGKADFWAYNTSNYFNKQNAKNDVFKMSREAINMNSGAMVLYKDNARYVQTDGPIVVHAIGTTLSAWNMRTKNMAWSIPNRPCIWTPTPTNARRAAICVGGTHDNSGNPTFAVDYDGNILWESQIGSSYPAEDAGEVEAFLSSKAGIIGVDPIKGVPPSTTSGHGKTSAGVIILAIFLIAFSIIALAGIARFVFGRRGASYNKTSASPNRAGAEEGGKPTLSTRSMHDVESGSEGKPLNEGAGYGGLN